MNRTEREDRAIDALITRTLLEGHKESDISEAEVEAFLGDKTPLSTEDTEMLRRLDPLARIDGRQTEAQSGVLQFPEQAPRYRAAARQQATEITDPEVLSALAEKRKEAVERARKRRSPDTDKGL